MRHRKGLHVGLCTLHNQLATFVACCDDTSSLNGPASMRDSPELESVFCQAPLEALGNGRGDLDDECLLAHGTSRGRP